MAENPADEPSPENIFATWGVPDHPGPDPKIPECNIYLTDAAPGMPANCIKGIRTVLQGLRATGERVSAADASALWERFVGGERPLLLGYAVNVTEALRIAQAGVDAANGRLDIGVNLSADDLAEAAPGPEPDATTHTPLPDGEAPEDWVPTLVACKLALNLLAQHDGQASSAYAWAGIMGGNDPDGQWTDVRWLLASAFPGDPRG